MQQQNSRSSTYFNFELGHVHSAAPTIGHNSGATPEVMLAPDEIAAIEASWRDATLPARIALAYVEGRAPPFSPGQIPSGLSQAAILQNGMLRCLVMMARFDRHMDLRPVLMALIGSFSANKHWQATVSAGRLARLLDRHERTIRRNLGKLVDEQRIIQVNRAGFTTAYSLPITELDATPGISPTVILDVLAPKEGGRWGGGHREPNESAFSNPKATPDNILSGAGSLAPDTNCDSPGHSGCPPNKESNNNILGCMNACAAGQDNNDLAKQAHESSPLGPKHKERSGPISAWDKANPPAGYVYDRGVFVNAVSVASGSLGTFRFDDLAQQINAKLPSGVKVEAADIRGLVIAKIVRDAENRKAGVQAATLDPRYAASNIATDIARSLSEAKRNASTAFGYKGKFGSATTGNAGRTPPSPEAIAAATSVSEWLSIIALYTKTKKWTGPGRPPGEHGCLVPAQLVDIGAAQ